MSKPKKTNDRVIALPFQNNLFFRSVYDWEGCTTIADYTGLWPQYRVYNEEGYYIGCTNASNELSWQAAVREDSWRSDSPYREWECCKSHRPWSGYQCPSRPES